MTELHHQLNPYLRAADDEHRATGLPIARHLLLAWPALARARDAARPVPARTRPSGRAGDRARQALTERCGCRPGAGWTGGGSASFVEPRGSYRLERLRVLRGGRDVTLPAPLGQPPLLLRAGAVLPLIGADVDTLSPYGRAAGLVRLADRARPPAPACRPAWPHPLAAARRRAGGIGRAPPGRALAAAASDAAADAVHRGGVAGFAAAPVPAPARAAQWQAPVARALAL